MYEDFKQWLRCPICGDEGEHILWLVSKTGGIKFKCQSHEHRCNRRRYSRYVRKDKVRKDWVPNSFFERFINLLPDSNINRMGNLKDCIECPHCDYSQTDGSIELVITNTDSVHRYLTFIATCWCSSCESYARNSLSSSEGQTNYSDEQLDDFSDFPPEYIQ